MDLGLTGKIIIVTGGASGIGGAISEALAQEGAVPVIFARRTPDPALLDRVTTASPLAGWVQVELSDDAQCRAAVKATLARWGRIDGLVNNAGANDSIGLDAGPDAFRASLDRNLIHYYTLAHLTLPQLRANQGAIVNISSKTAITGQGNTSAYVAAKHGVIGFTKTVALEVAQDNITCNAICPGFVETPIVEKQIADQARTRGMSKEAVLKDVILGSQPTKRFVTTDELTGMMLYLVSDLGASANGASFSIDGGWTAQ